MLKSSEDRLHSNAWAPDGKTLLFHAHETEGTELWTLNVESKPEGEALTDTPQSEDGPVFSPDGHWIAYASDESGGSEIYVQPYDVEGRKEQVSVDGGTEPFWAATGELFFRRDNNWLSARISTAPELEMKRPQLLLEARDAIPSPVGPYASYAVSQDGQRLLMIKGPANQISPVVVLNWFEELKQVGR